MALQRSPTFLAPGTSFVEDSFSTDGEGGAADEALLAHPPLTSCRASRFLTGLRPVLVYSPGVGDPALRDSKLAQKVLSGQFPGQGKDGMGS